MAAEGTVRPGGRVDVARRVGASPQRVTAALEDPRAQIDEERAGDGKRDPEGQQRSQHLIIQSWRHAVIRRSGCLDEG
jgi:hypothetical protein